jgi:hypothetical protein
VKQTKQEQQEGIAAVEAKLRTALAALVKAESAQPGQGGYYFAAAPTRTTMRMSPAGSAQTSREASPTRGDVSSPPARPSSMTRELPKGHFSEPINYLDRQRRLRELSSSPPSLRSPSAGKMRVPKSERRSRSRSSRGRR